MASIAQYIVRERETGRELVRGSAQQCADALGLTRHSFVTTASLARRGRTRYIIERIDDRRSRPDPGKAGYPCSGCPSSTHCSGMHEVCPAWRRWFTEGYAAAAQRIRAAAQKED